MSILRGGLRYLSLRLEGMEKMLPSETNVCKFVPICDVANYLEEISDILQFQIKVANYLDNKRPQAVSSWMRDHLKSVFRKKLKWACENTTSYGQINDASHSVTPARGGFSGGSYRGRGNYRGNRGRGNSFQNRGRGGFKRQRTDYTHGSCFSFNDEYVFLYMFGSGFNATTVQNFLYICW